MHISKDTQVHFMSFSRFSKLLQTTTFQDRESTDLHLLPRSQHQHDNSRRNHSAEEEVGVEKRRGRTPVLIICQSHTHCSRVDIFLFLHFLLCINNLKINNKGYMRYRIRTKHFLCFGFRQKYILRTVYTQRMYMYIHTVNVYFRLFMYTCQNVT